ncbi:MAG: proline iminopeptidase [Actinomycetota bacterium]|jgi:proline iminopeptidase
MNLPVADGHVLHYEEHGNPDGVPAVILHGGPGSGMSPTYRTFFDESRFRIVEFDQRNCGGSTPHASDPSVSLETNTTGNLLQDIEALRAHLGIDRWVVFGVSWGSTLGIAYAETCPERVIALVVAGIALGRQSEITWLYETIAPLFPVEYARLIEGIDGDVVAAYRDKANDPDPAVRAEFARRWTEWDWMTSSVTPTTLSGRWAEPDFQLARTRICTHYFSGDFMGAGVQLVRPHHLARLNECDGVILNGRLDLQCPLAGAVELKQLWPRADLVIVDGAGHSPGDGGMPAAITAALNRWS